MAINLENWNRGAMMDIIGDTKSGNIKWHQWGNTYVTIWEGVFVQAYDSAVYLKSATKVELFGMFSGEQFNDLFDVLYAAAKENANRNPEEKKVIKASAPRPLKMYPNNDRGENIPAIKKTEKPPRKPYMIEKRVKQYAKQLDNELHKKKTKHIKVQFEMWIDKE